MACIKRIIYKKGGKKYVPKKSQTEKYIVKIGLLHPNVQEKLQTHVVPKIITNSRYGSPRPGQMKNVYSQVQKYNLRLSFGEKTFVTSITLRKNILALWILMAEKHEEDPQKTIMDFIDSVCLKRWKGDTAKGFSDFVTKCMIHSLLESADFELYKKIYLSL